MFVWLLAVGVSIIVIAFSNYLALRSSNLNTSFNQCRLDTEKSITSVHKIHQRKLIDQLSGLGAQVDMLITFLPPLMYAVSFSAILLIVSILFTLFGWMSTTLVNGPKMLLQCYLGSSLALVLYNEWVSTRLQPWIHSCIEVQKMCRKLVDDTFVDNVMARLPEKPDPVPEETKDGQHEKDHSDAGHDKNAPREQGNVQ